MVDAAYGTAMRVRFRTRLGRSWPKWDQRVGQRHLAVQKGRPRSPQGPRDARFATGAGSCKGANRRSRCGAGMGPDWARRGRRPFVPRFRRGGGRAAGGRGGRAGGGPGLQVSEWKQSTTADVQEVPKRSEKARSSDRNGPGRWPAASATAEEDTTWGFTRFGFPARPELRGSVRRAGKGAENRGGGGCAEQRVRGEQHALRRNRGGAMMPGFVALARRHRGADRVLRGPARAASRVFGGRNWWDLQEIGAPSATPEFRGPADRGVRNGNRDGVFP